MMHALVILSVLLLVAIAIICYLLATRPAPKAQEERLRMLAKDIFVQNSRIMHDDNDRHLSEILAPIKENFFKMQQIFAESYSREARERYSLQEKLRELIQSSDIVGREARLLSTALKGNTRVQGQWGEMILQNILERSGLRNGEEYSMQQTTINDAGGRLRPDAIINFPDGRKIIIDSKVSLKAYLDMADEADENQQKVLARMHLTSVRNHINELRDKKYHSYIGSAKADFTMMFIPNEGAYIAAMQADDSLWQYAYDNQVIIVSPTHLMAVVKIIEQTWLHDKQNRNAVEIAVEGGRLIDKLVTFLSDMDKINAALGAAQRAYDSAITKLNGRGGIISRAEKLQDLGAKASRRIPNNQLDEPLE